MPCKEANMGSQPWLDRVRARLEKKGLPPIYVRRFMEELTDHDEDLQQERVEAASRLGEPEQVADAAVAAYRRRSFLGRHPLAALLVFGISPVMTQVVLMVLLSLTGPPWFGSAWGPALGIGICSALSGILYCELALWLGLDRKWPLASCVVLGAFASLLGSRIPGGGNMHWTLFAVQFAFPLALGWVRVRRTGNDTYPLTAFIVFALSPFACYQLLSILAVLITSAVLASVLGGSPSVVMLLLAGAALVVAVRWYRRHAKGARPVRKWIALCCLAISAFPAVLSLPLWIMFVAPSAAASLLYCGIGRRFGVGRKWMLVSCVVLAACAVMHCLGRPWFEYYDTSGQYHSCDWLMVCVALAQVVVPLAVGWRFASRNRDSGQLQMAA